MIDGPPASLFPALLVEPDHVDRVRAHSALAEAGFQVIVTNDFQAAQEILLTQPPLVLVTTVRLGAFNGLDLALCGYAQRRRMAVIMTSSIPDPALQAEAERIGATFVLKPVTPDDFLAAVYRTALRPVATGSTEPIRPPFERRRTDRRAMQTPVPVERRCAPRRRDVGDVLLGLPAAV